ncbi:MAG: heme exporter protein CcmD [Pseudomonadota bacterium]
MAEFFKMGGYAGYIWPAYGVTAVLLGMLVFAILRRTRQRLQALDAQKAASRPKTNSPNKDPEASGQLGDTEPASE